MMSTPFSSNFNLITSDLSLVIIPDTLYEYVTCYKQSELILEPGKDYWIKLSSEKQ